MSRFVLIFNLIFIVFVLITINSGLISGQISCTCPPTEENLSTLKSVYVLMRHGIRAPWTTYPLDPFANDTTRFPNGKSQLTDAGIEQAYNVGKFLKKKYKNFMKNNQKQAFLRASAAQRCIDTISIVAKKLWPPDVDEEKSWQPMIFSLPKDIDSVLYEEPICHPADQVEKDNLKTKEVQEYESDPKIQELYRFVAEKTGLGADMYNVTKAFDCIRCEKLNNLQSPDWATPDRYEQMGDVLSKRLNFFYKTTEAQRLRAGPILSDFKTQMDNVINSKPKDKPKNIFIYGTHDFKISAVLNGLGDPQPKYPPFAAAIIFELHKIGDQNIVRALYVNQTVNWPYTAIKLNLSKCKKGGNFTSDKSIIDDIAQNITEKVTDKVSAISSLALPKLPKMPKLSDLPNVPEFALDTNNLFGQTAGEDKECTFENFVNSIADLTPVDWRTECGLDCKYDPFKAAEEGLGKT